MTQPAASPQVGPKQLSSWEKADIIGKVISGVGVALIALFVKLGTDNITAAQKEGELVQSLLADLTTKDIHARQDLALIALNHAVGDRHPALITDIAERLVLDTTAYSGADRNTGQALGGIAFKILQQRDSSRARSLKTALEAQYERQLNSDTTLRGTLRSQADTSKPRPGVGGPAGTAPAPAGAILARVSSNVVFLQFRGALERQTIDDLRKRLTAGGFVTPRAERVAVPFASSIRYFHPDDVELADSVASITSEFIGAIRPTLTVPVQLHVPKGGAVPKGQIEVWLNW